MFGCTNIPKTGTWKRNSYFKYDPSEWNQNEKEMITISCIYYNNSFLYCQTVMSELQNFFNHININLYAGYRPLPDSTSAIEIIVSNNRTDCHHARSTSIDPVKRKILNPGMHRQLSTIFIVQLSFFSPFPRRNSTVSYPSPGTSTRTKFDILLSLSTQNCLRQFETPSLGECPDHLRTLLWRLQFRYKKFLHYLQGGELGMRQMLAYCRSLEVNVKKKVLVLSWTRQNRRTM